MEVWYSIVMLKTISIKLKPTAEQGAKLHELLDAYSQGCNMMVQAVREHRCWNKVALHHLVYYKVREALPLSANLTQKATAAVCTAYKSLKSNGHIKRNEPVPEISFKGTAVHMDRQMYSFRDDLMSLQVIGSRMKGLRMAPGNFQRQALESGAHKEGDLIFRKGEWYFNLVIETLDTPAIEGVKILGIDLGINNLAATSDGALYGGKQLIHERSRYLAKRSALQSKCTQSALQKLRKSSGKESRHVKHVNHCISKKIVAEALASGATLIKLEDLTNIRDRIQAGRKMRGRLHGWAFRQLQTFIQYKANGSGIKVEFINPAYTSQTCSACGELGTRKGSLFKCSCGLRANADLNAAKNMTGGGFNPASRRCKAAERSSLAG